VIIRNIKDIRCLKPVRIFAKSQKVFVRKRIGPFFLASLKTTSYLSFLSWKKHKISQGFIYLLIKTSMLVYLALYLVFGICCSQFFVKFP
jgi:hypothetical protein